MSDLRQSQKGQVCRCSDRSEKKPRFGEQRDEVACQQSDSQEYQPLVFQQLFDASPFSTEAAKAPVGNSIGQECNRMILN